MFYTFAHNLTLEETRAVVQEHNDALGVTAFIEADRGEYVIFNYLITFDGSWKSFTGDPVEDRKAAIIRECRGLTFYKDSGEVAARKLNKFFNCGQNEESQPHNIDWSFPHKILTKLDGSMITPYRTLTGEFRFHTKMGDTDVASLANEFVIEHQQYVEFAQFCFNEKCTPIFEFCSRKQKIVIDYPEDALTLLAVRDNTSGDYMPYESMLHLGDKFNIPVVTQIDGSVTDPIAFLEQVRVLQGEEGYVIRFDNGMAVKVKAEDYLRLHNMVDLLQREKDVLALVLSGSLDDALPLMDDSSRERVGNYVEAIERGVAVTAKRLTDYANYAVEQAQGDQKRLAMEFINIDSVVSRERGMLFQIARGREATEVVLDFVRKNIGSGPKVAEVRDLFGDVRWDDYRDSSVLIED